MPNKTTIKLETIQIGRRKACSAYCALFNVRIGKCNYWDKKRCPIKKKPAGIYVFELVERTTES